MEFCPTCGERSWVVGRPCRCGSCGFELYLNVAAAVAGVVVCGGKVLASVRGNEPDVGMLDLPGGFADPGETGEFALARELEEELGLQGIRPEYFGSYPNVYPYKGVVYHTLDMVFVVQLECVPVIACADDVADVEWIELETIELERFAFGSIRAALRDYVASARDEGE